MARIRSIHPDAFKSDKLTEASAEGERCYWRLLPVCDDDGRAEDNPVVLAATMFPTREDILSSAVNGWLEELHELGLIVRYVIDSQRYLVVTRWADYQHPNRKIPSDIPELPEDHATRTRIGGTSLRTHERLSERSVSPHEHARAVVGEGEGDGDGDGGEKPSVELVSNHAALSESDTSPSPSATEMVFSAWQESTGHRQAKLDPKRKRAITSALKDYTVADLIDAVRGWRHFPHNRGENERNTVYDDLTLLLRDAEHIERFRDAERNPPSVIPTKFQGLARFAGAQP